MNSLVPLPFWLILPLLPMTVVVPNLESAQPLASVSVNLAMKASPAPTPQLTLPLSLLKSPLESISSGQTSQFSLIIKFSWISSDSPAHLK